MRSSSARYLGRLFLLAGGLLFSGFASATEFERSLYLNINMGYSALEPKSECDCYDITDTNDGGVEIAAGYDLLPRFSLEAYYADLGKAKVRDVDAGTNYAVEYQSSGVNLTAYLFKRSASWQDVNTFSGRAFSPYLKLGGGQIKNDSSLAHDRNQNFQFQFGAGIEFSLGEGFAARTAVTSYGGDAQMFSIGLVKRFGQPRWSTGRQQAPARPTVATVAPQPEPVRRLPPKSGPLFSLSLPTLYFEPGSDDLSKPDKRLLLNLAGEIRNYYKVKVLIKGYADDATPAQGGDLMLSLKRAMRVKNLLVGFGVPRTQLDAQGLGSADLEAVKKQPLKRRVEFDIDFR
ncbi:MAG: OmpA family protein [Thiotrichales bacterium]